MAQSPFTIGSHPAPGAGDIHVWSSTIELAAPELPALESVLAGDERARAARFHFAKDRAQFVAARGLLRILVGSHLGIAPAEVRLRYEPEGKPELVDDGARHDVRFNVSHSHGAFIIAIARGHAVGVDLERMRAEVECEEIAESHFAPAEREQLHTLSGDEKRRGFFNGWTRKEAYLKAKGRGIGYGLDQFAVTLVPGEPARLLFDRCDPEAASRWRLHAWSPAPDYAAALAIESSGAKITHFRWAPPMAAADTFPEKTAIPQTD